MSQGSFLERFFRFLGRSIDALRVFFGRLIFVLILVLVLTAIFSSPETVQIEDGSLVVLAPTGAIVEPYLLDAERCISYLTIEYRGSADDLPAELRKKTGNRIFGCDDCLDICPFNVNAKATTEPGFQPSPWTLHPRLPELAKLTKDEFQSLTIGSPLRRPKHEGFIRNVQIGLDNHAPHIPLS